MGGGGEHEVGGLAHGHEVAHHLGVGDRDRSAAGDLRLEHRHHGAGRAENVAEAHGDEPGRLRAGALRIEGLRHHLGEALGDAELRDRLDRLVGGDHHQGAGARRDGGLGDVDRAEDVGLDALGPVALEIGHLLQRGGMEDVSGPEIADDRVQPLTVADVGQRALHLRLRVEQGRAVEDGVERRLRILDDEQRRGAEGDRPGADLRADRAAAAGHDHAGAGQEVFQSRPIDGDGGTQEEILDLQRREFGVAHPLAEAGDAGERQAETAGTGDEVVGLGFGRQGARRRHEPAHRQAAIGEIRHDLLQVAKPAEHGHAAHHLARLVRPRREDALGRQPLDRAGFDRPQHDLDVGAAAEQQGRRGGGPCLALPGAGVFQVAEGQPRAAEQEDLQDPVEGDGDLAEEVEAVEVRGDQHVIEHEQRQRGDARRAHDAGEVRQRGEAPLGAVEPEPRVDQPGIGQERRQQQRQRLQALGERPVLEAEDEGQHHGRRGRGEIVDDHHRRLEGALLHGASCQSIGP